MACDVFSVVALFNADLLDKLSSRDTMLALAAVLSTSSGFTAQQALDFATANGYDGLSDKDLWEILLDLFCAGPPP